MRSAEVQRAERAWLTRELTGGRTGLDAAWVALVLLNLVAIAVWPSWDTVPFHLISTGFEFEISLPDAAPRKTAPGS